MILCVNHVLAGGIFLRDVTWGYSRDRQRGLTSVLLRLLVPLASLKSSSASCCYYLCMPITERDGDSLDVHRLPAGSLVNDGKSEKFVLLLQDFIELTCSFFIISGLVVFQSYCL